MSFAGFDTDQYPGDAVMAALKAQTNLAWVALYLEAPSHCNGGWLGKRATLKGQGWGLLPVYVGQQVTGPGSHVVTGRQGAIDGADAAGKVIAEGFAPGSVCALDIENGAPFDSPMADYAEAWCTVFRGAGFTPMVYSSHAMAPEVATKIPGARHWIYQVPTLARTTAANPFPAPALGSFSFAADACQHRQNVAITVAGHTLLVDLDVAATADPSAP
jgi:hypothetical protein